MIKKLLLVAILVTPSICYSQEIDKPDLGENHIQADLNHDNRALNTIGQCVWSSIQNAGRQIGETRLYNLTRDPRCRGGASPSDVQRVLPTLGIKFEQEYRSREKCYQLMDKALKLGLPCIISYGTAHAINIVHLDFTANKIIVVNNHGDRFQNKLHTITEFDRLFKGWVVVIYPPQNAEQNMRQFRQRRLLDLEYYAPDGKKYKRKDFYSENFYWQD